MVHGACPARQLCPALSPSQPQHSPGPLRAQRPVPPSFPCSFLPPPRGRCQTEARSPGKDPPGHHPRGTCPLQAPCRGAVPATGVVQSPPAPRAAFPPPAKQHAPISRGDYPARILPVCSSPPPADLSGARANPCPGRHQLEPRSLRGGCQKHPALLTSFPTEPLGSFAANERAPLIPANPRRGAGEGGEAP